MKNSLRRIFALALVVMMIASLGMSAMAADNDTVTFTKTLTKEENAYAPNTTYTFTITPGAAVAAASGQDAVNAGQLDEVKFLLGTSQAYGKNADDTNNEDVLIITSAPADTDIGTGVDTLTYNCQVQIDLSKYEDPGIYRYVITETVGNYAGVTYDNVSRTLDVYIVTAENGTLSIGGTVLYKTGAALTTTEENGVVTKSYSDKGGFANDYDTADLTVSKTVTGNQGDKDKEFSFDVEITGVAGEQYYIVVYNADGSVKTKVEGETTKQLTYTITANAQNKATQTGIMLKNGEKFIVYGLSAGDTYVVTEADYSADGYTTTNNAETSNGRTGSGAIQAVTEGEVVNDNVTFTNNKQVTVPTGIAMTVLPFVAMIALAAIVAVLFFQKKERREA